MSRLQIADRLDPAAAARALGSLFCVLALQAALGVPAAAQGQPLENVVWIVVDDLGWSDGGVFGSPTYRTPSVDRLAGEGVRFTQAYSASAVCSPSRAALLTGRDPARLGITDWIHHSGPEAREDLQRGAFSGGFDRDRGRALATPRNRAWLPLPELTLAEHLAVHCGASAYVGKWHLGPLAEEVSALLERPEGSQGYGPRAQGFGENHGGCAHGQPPGWYDPFGNQRYSGIPGLPSKRPGQYLTAREADEAVSFLERSAGEPFLLVLAQYAVHSPIEAPAELVAEVARRPTSHHGVAAYGAMVEASDQAVGRVLDALDRLELSERTLVVYTSDNGGATHFPATDNRPLRSGKGRPYEGGLRVPLVLRAPGRIPAGTTTDAPVVGTDLVPTVLGALGVPPAFGSEGAAFDGVDLWPLATGRISELAARPLVWHFPHYWWGTRVAPYSVLRAGRWKLIHRYDERPPELYDLQTDPGEARDLAAAQPARVEELSMQLFARLAELGARFPRPATPR